VYHVVSLKKYIGDSPQEQVQLPPIKRGQVLPVPAKVLCARLNRGTWEVSVKWFGRSQAETTWEDLEEFKGQIPKLLARGQTVSRGLCCGRFPWNTIPEALEEGRQVENRLEIEADLKLLIKLAKV